MSNANAPAPAGYQNGSSLDLISDAFETGSDKMMNDLNTAGKALTDDPTSPSVLANYQAKLSEYTLFRNAQTSTVKAYKDISAAIIQNFR